MLLGFCKLLQAAVSKPVLHNLHTCSITNAKGNQCNSTDLFCLQVVVLVLQPFAQYGRGCNLHNLHILRALFPQQLLVCQELPTRLDGGIIQKTGDTLQLQLGTTLEKGGGTDSHQVYTTDPLSTLPNMRSYGVGNHSAHPNNHELSTSNNKTRSGCLTPAFSAAQKRAEILRHPCILGDPQRQARGAKSEVVVPNKRNKIRSACLTPAFSGPQKRAEMLRHPCILGDPQRQARGAKSEVAAPPLPSRGPKRRQKWYVTRAFSGIPNKGENNHKCLPHPNLLGGPKKGGNATSPLHSCGSPTPSMGSKIRCRYLTPAFLGVPKQGDKIRRNPEEGTKSKVATSPEPCWGSP